LIEGNMTRRDEGKTSLVDFLRSLKFSHSNQSAGTGECPTHFAHFEQRVQTPRHRNSEDSQLIRSAN
jgi:hypothetical protein